MGSVARLWNPRSSQKLPRHWFAYDDRIIIGGDSVEQSGVLSVRRARRGELRARLLVMGRQYEESVDVGNDIVIWINGLKLFIGVKAVEDERMLIAFGIPHGSTVNVIVESGADLDEGARAFPWTGRHAHADDLGCPIGLCQTRF